MVGGAKRRIMVAGETHDHLQRKKEDELEQFRAEQYPQLRNSTAYLDWATKSLYPRGLLQSCLSALESDLSVHPQSLCRSTGATASLCQSTGVTASVCQFTRDTASPCQATRNTAVRAGGIGGLTDETKLINDVRNEMLVFLGGIPSTHSLIFTKGTADGCRIIAENFPFRSFAYKEDVDTSVFGIRNGCIQSGCYALGTLTHDFSTISELRTDDAVLTDYGRSEVTRLGDTPQNYTVPDAWFDASSDKEESSDSKESYDLLAVSLESSFDGSSLSKDQWKELKTLRKKYPRMRLLLDAGNGFGRRFIHTDAEKGKFSLCEINGVRPDFIIVSFDKIFGFPTSVGCLIVRHSSSTLLLRERNERMWSESQQLHSVVEGEKRKNVEWVTPSKIPSMRRKNSVGSTNSEHEIGLSKWLDPDVFTPIKEQSKKSESCHESPNDEGLGDFFKNSLRRSSRKRSKSEVEPNFGRNGSKSVLEKSKGSKSSSIDIRTEKSEQSTSEALDPHPDDRRNGKNRAQNVIPTESNLVQSAEKYFGSDCVDAVSARSLFAVLRTDLCRFEQADIVGIRMLREAKRYFEENPVLHNYSQAVLCRKYCLEQLNRLAEGFSPISGVGSSGAAPPVAVQIFGECGEESSSAESSVLTFLLWSSKSINGETSVGALIPPSDVVKAASEKGIVLRAGSLSSPGACQRALQISDTDVRRNYTLYGHTINDPTIMNIGNQALGVVRVSFGPTSTIGDVDVFIHFLYETYYKSASLNAESDSKFSVTLCETIEKNYEEAIEKQIYYAKETVARRIAARGCMNPPHKFPRIDARFVTRTPEFDDVAISPVIMDLDDMSGMEQTPTFSAISLSTEMQIGVSPIEGETMVMPLEALPNTGVLSISAMDVATNTKTNADASKNTNDIADASTKTTGPCMSETTTVDVASGTVVCESGTSPMKTAAICDSSASPIKKIVSSVSTSTQKTVSHEVSTSPIRATNTGTSPIKSMVCATSTSPIKPTVCAISTSPIKRTVCAISTSPMEGMTCDMSTSPVLPMVNESSTSPTKRTFSEASTSPMKATTCSSSTSPVLAMISESGTSPIKPVVCRSSTSPMQPPVCSSSTSPIRATCTESGTSPIKPAVMYESSTSPIKAGTCERSTSPMDSATCESSTSHSKHLDPPASQLAPIQRDDVCFPPADDSDSVSLKDSYKGNSNSVSSGSVSSEGLRNLLGKDLSLSINSVSDGSITVDETGGDNPVDDADAAMVAGYSGLNQKRTRSKRTRMPTPLFSNFSIFSCPVTPATSSPSKFLSQQDALWMQIMAIQEDSQRQIQERKAASIATMRIVSTKKQAANTSPNRRAENTSPGKGGSKASTTGGATNDPFEDPACVIDEISVHVLKGAKPLCIRQNGKLYKLSKWVMTKTGGLALDKIMVVKDEDSSTRAFASSSKALSPRPRDVARRKDSHTAKTLSALKNVSMELCLERRVVLLRIEGGKRLLSVSLVELAERHGDAKLVLDFLDRLEERRHEHGDDAGSIVGEELVAYDVRSSRNPSQTLIQTADEIPVTEKPEDFIKDLILCSSFSDFSRNFKLVFE